jgi:LPS-assembly protein
MCDFITPHTVRPMHLSRSVQAVVFVLAQFALVAQAAEPGLKLKSQPSLHTLPMDPQGSPVFFEADRLEGTASLEVQATGRAVVSKYGEQISADDLYYSVEGDWLVGTGGVRYWKPDEEMFGDQIFLNLAEDRGFVDHPSYRLSQNGIRGNAESIRIDSRQRFHVEQGTYTSCEVGSDDWLIRADSLDLDRTREVGVARNATVVFKGVPILYSPYMDFSLSGRKSGFLPPSIGTTAQSGFEVITPFYWNIAPNRDATIAPRFLTKRGVMLSNEFRYLDARDSGEFHGDYLGNDHIAQTSRYAVTWLHNQDFGNGFSGGVNAQKVSDDAYFTDLSDKIAVTSQTNLPREAYLSYGAGWWNATLRTQRFQTLQDPLAPIVPPYARAPQFTLGADRAGVYGMDLALSEEWVRFEHPYLISGQRQTLYPSVSVPLQTSFFHITPKFGFSQTRYTFDDPSVSSQLREVPIYSVDSGVTFERETTMFGRASVQTLEPRLYYVYIPFRDQSQLPNFDSAVADFNFAQIFTENQFTGGDRINDANQLTAAVASRIIDTESGAENLRFLLGQRFYFADQRVTLDTTPREASKSDILAAFSGKIAPTWSADIGLQYDATRDRVQQSSVVFRHQPDVGKVFNVSYRLARDSLEQVDMSAQWPLTSKLSGLWRWNYSLRDRRTVETLAGLEYNGGCWAFRLVAHRFASTTQETVNAIFLQLELNGISRIGSNPLDLLRQSVIGYTKTNDPVSNDKPLPGTP